MKAGSTYFAACKRNTVGPRPIGPNGTADFHPYLRITFKER